MSTRLKTHFMKKNIPLKLAARPIVICAQQRSGTTVLQRTMDMSPYVKNYGEVFHTKEYYPNENYPNWNKLGFFFFKERLLKKSPQLLYANHKNQALIFKRYFQFLAKQAQKEYFVVDIKYNSWHHFNGVWQNNLFRPYCLELARKNNFYIIHLIRQNVFEQYLSNIYASKLEQYHFTQQIEIDQSQKQIKINPRKCRQAMLTSQRNTQLFKNWFRNYSNYIEIFYEDMFTQKGSFSKRTLNAINKLVDKDLEIPATPCLKKIIKKPSEFISNKKQIIAVDMETATIFIAAFKNAPFEKDILKSLEK